MTKVGTLRELNVKPGDVVEYLADGEIGTIDDTMIWRGNYGNSQKVSCSEIAGWRIVSRASDEPKIWRDMTDEEKGALLLAWHEGKVIEVMGTTWVRSFVPAFLNNSAYRVKPESVRETENLYWRKNTGFNCGYEATHRITFDLIDGEPDPASIKMEKIS